MTVYRDPQRSGPRRLLLGCLVLGASLSLFACALEGGRSKSRTTRASGPAVAEFSDADSLGVLRPQVLEASKLAQLPLDARLPLTPDVRSGQLANGFRFFIRRSTEPAGRAELRFVIDAGSLMENEEERGLAHFMEHMLFNGTRRFPGKNVMLTLQDLGTFNAYTGYDDTVCVLKVPTENLANLAVTFDIMQDWATGVLLDPAEINAERGVIIEERRMRNLSAGGRAAQTVRALYLDGSRYAERSPIGLVEVIKTVPRDTLENFYRTWYRPDRMAVIAVGDFDPAKVEAMILERFSGLQNPPKAVSRPPSEVPDHAKPLFAVLTDSEQPVTEVTVGWKRLAPALVTVGSYRDFLIYQLFDRMLAFRLLEAAQSPEAPMIQPTVGRSLFVRELEVWSAGTLAREGQAPEALEALLAEVERVRRFGFARGEFARAKQDIAASYERAAAEQVNTPSLSLADELVRHVTTDEPVPGIAAEQALAARFLPTITLDDLNREARRLGPENRVVVVRSPEKDGLVPPKEADLAAAMERVRKSELTAYEEEQTEAELLAEIPEPAEIVERREIPEIGAVEIVLENGARVLYKQTGIREQEVLFAASSPGGASLVSDADYAEASLAPRVAAEAGVGRFSRLDLLKVLSGREITVFPLIDDYFEGLQGEARTADLTSLFQLVHLYFTEPRVDASAFERVRGEYVTRLQNLQAVPEAEFEKVVNELLYGDTIRAGLLPLEEVEKLDSDRLFSIFRERFSNAADFSFSFVGSFDPAELEDLARRYIGTLPATAARENFVDHLKDPPDTVVRRTVVRGKENRSRVRLLFEGSLDRITPQTYMLATLLKQALGELLSSELREARGAVYDVATVVSVFEIPSPSYRVSVDFTTDPQRVDELIGAVFANIKTLRERGPSELTVAVVRESERRDREESLASNGFWLGILERIGKLPNFDPAEVAAFEAQFGQLTAGDVREFAQRVLSPNRYVQVVLVPENAQGAAE